MRVAWRRHTHSAARNFFDATLLFASDTPHSDAKDESFHSIGTKIAHHVSPFRYVSSSRGRRYCDRHILTSSGAGAATQPHPSHSAGGKRSASVRMCGGGRPNPL